MVLPTNRRQTLVLALYFDEDSPHTQQMIADKFGVTRSAISHRIRKGKAILRAAGYKIPPMPGGRAPKNLAQLSVCGSLEN